MPAMQYTTLVHGFTPRIERCRSFAEEVQTIIDFVKAADDPKSTYLVIRTHHGLDECVAALRERRVPTYRLLRSEAEDRDRPDLRLATMHRVKRPEFDRMMIAGGNEGRVPLLVGDAESEDRGVREQAELRERALFYVASTRARRELLVTSGSKPSHRL